MKTKMGKAGAAALAATLLCSVSAMAAVTPAQKCESGKNDAAGKYVSCLHKAQSKFVKGGETDLTGYNEAVAKCLEKYDSKWSKLETDAGGACPSNGDQSSMEAFLEACTTSAAGALGGGALPVDVTTCNSSLSSCNDDLLQVAVILEACDDNYNYLAVELPVWQCNPANYGAGDGCHCGCGLIDPDCSGPLVGACADCSECLGCGNVNATNNSRCSTVPAAWRCPVAYYDAADGCDCGCGAPDPDCADALAASCEYCSELGSCNYQGCPGTINATDNTICD